MEYRCEPESGEELFFCALGFLACLGGFAGLADGSAELGLAEAGVEVACLWCQNHQARAEGTGPKAQKSAAAQRTRSSRFIENSPFFVCSIAGQRAAPVPKGIRA